MSSSSRFDSDSPTSVTPRSSISGMAATSSSRPTARIVRVSKVDSSSVCERVVRSDRAAPAAAAHPARVVVVGERVEMAAGGAAQHLDHLHLRQLGYLG